MAPTGGELLVMKQFDPMTETREWHAAASSADCNNIARRLKSQGLKVFLADRQRRNDPLLPIACIFEGQDADPNAERFLSPQHNNH
ncbi:hypothetical protein H6G00_01370 [Leptolyngbya sp. FACHB-541]|nr:hypothetical protein [Leptolyngbya sp. FACHB-541]